MKLELGPDAKPFNPEDISRIAAHKGKLGLEKSLCELVTSNATLLKMCDEVMRTSSSCIGLLPERDRLIETMTSIQVGSVALTPTRLLHAVTELPKLREGIRRMDMEELDGLVVSLLRTAASSIMNGKMSVTTRLVTYLVKAGSQARCGRPPERASGR